MNTVWMALVAILPIVIGAASAVAISSSARSSLSRASSTMRSRSSITAR